MKPLFFLDTETAGLKDPRLLQLAFVSDQGHAPFSRMYKPPVPIEIEAMEVNHVTEKMVASKPPFSADKEEVSKLLGTGIVVAHNASFDLRVLEAEGIYIHEWVCTMRVAKPLWPEFKAHRLQYLRYRLGIEIEAGAHEAEADVMVLQHVFDACLKEFEKRPEFKGQPQRMIEEMARLSKG